MSATYFISDLHLDPARPHLSGVFYALLDDLRGCDGLYILGDLFDTWVGDDDDSELAIETIRALAAFTGSGTPLNIMHGNRDFLIGPTFCRQTGATLLPDPSLITLYGEAVLIMHGDTLCTDDEDYQAFRTSTRDPDWQAEVLARALPERRELASRLRMASAEAKSNKPEDIVDASEAAVATIMRDHGVRQLIHGHTHRPACHEYARGRRWVLGDWETAPVGLKVTSEEWTLFNIS